MDLHRNNRKIILSASRRTDIPAFYMDWFMEQIEAGFFSVENPFNGHVRTVPARPDDVHTIVFWSKDFGAFLRGGYGKRLQQMGERYDMLKLDQSIILC